MGNTEENCLLLVIAQTYELKELEKDALKKPKIRALTKIKCYGLNNRINYSNYRAIVEKKMTEMERDLADNNFEIERLNSDVESMTSQVVLRSSKRIGKNLCNHRNQISY